jgi:signal transduction histidine kinase
MSEFQIILSYISAILLTISILYFLRFLLVTQAVDKFTYFALSTFGCASFIFFELLLSYPITPGQALLFHRLKLASLVFASVFWLLCTYEIFFPRSRVPRIFMFLGLMVALAIPFPFFLHLPVRHLQVVFLGLRFDYRFASYAPGYTLLSLLIFGTYGFSVLKTLLSSLSWRTKGLALLCFIPNLVAGINDFAVGRGLRSGILLAEFIVFFYLFVTLNVFFIEEQHNHRRLQRVNVELEQLVGERTTELQRANSGLSGVNEELRLANLHRTELMGIAAHDLKNPLQTILGCAELIMKETGANERLRKQTDLVRRAAQRMLGLIERLLESTALESGEIKLQPRRIDLAALARQVVEGSMGAASAKRQRIGLSGDTGCRVDADEVRLQEIIDNLVSNAIKFSPSGKEIQVRVVDADPHVRLEVWDEGPGLSSEEQANLFEKFKRLGPRPTGGEASAGLGLYIAKKLVELQGGEIRVDSEPGRGSTFIVTFPKAG